METAVLFINFISSSEYSLSWLIFVPLFSFYPRVCSDKLRKMAERSLRMLIMVLRISSFLSRIRLRL